MDNTHGITITNTPDTEVAVESLRDGCATATPWGNYEGCTFTVQNPGGAVSPAAQGALTWGQVGLLIAALTAARGV